jgi:Tfp pilus assembly protein PilZ
MLALRVPRRLERLGTVAELRRYERTPLDVAVTFSSKGGERLFAGRAPDISLGGMFIETTEALPFGDEMVVFVAFPRQRGTFSLPGIVRWTRRGGMGIQFGLLGARETHAITRLSEKG